MIGESEIIHPSNVEQVLFFGANSISLNEFRIAFQQPGTPGYHTIMYGEPYFVGGVFKRERRATGIRDERILWPNTINVHGKKTLLVLADIEGNDKNRSVLDFALSELRNNVKNAEIREKNAKQENTLLRTFVKEKNLEDTWEEWITNKLELLRVAKQKTERQETDSSVSVEVDKKKKE